jgi:hypothetical protein
MMDRRNTEEFSVQTGYMVSFYLLLLAWTVGSLPLVWNKFQSLAASRTLVIYGAMVVFVYVYTWFWSLGIFYRIGMDSEGNVTMKSIRRELRVSARQISRAEGSRFPHSFGFIKLKLPKESGYIFCLRKDEAIERFLQGIKRQNPLLIRINI